MMIQQLSRDACFSTSCADSVLDELMLGERVSGRKAGRDGVPCVDPAPGRANLASCQTVFPLRTSVAFYRDNIEAQAPRIHGTSPGLRSTSADSASRCRCPPSPQPCP